MPGKSCQTGCHRIMRKGNKEQAQEETGKLGVRQKGGELPNKGCQEPAVEMKVATAKIVLRQQINHKCGQLSIISRMNKFVCTYAFVSDDLMHHSYVRFFLSPQRNL